MLLFLIGYLGERIVRVVLGIISEGPHSAQYWMNTHKGLDSALKRLMSKMVMKKSDAPNDTRENKVSNDYV